MSAVAAIGPLGMGALGDTAALAAQSSGGGPSAAVRDFEALFLEMLLRHAGLERALSGGDESGGGVAGELFVRAIAHSLATQVDLGLARYSNTGDQ